MLTLKNKIDLYIPHKGGVHLDSLSSNLVKTRGTAV